LPFALPDETTFQDGDFLWVKEKDALVPYSGLMTKQNKLKVGYPTRTEWEHDRREFLMTIQGKRNSASEYEKRLAAVVSNLAYEKLACQYLENREYESAVHFSASIVYCGHVGILTFEHGQPLVIEATPPRVRSVRYKSDPVSLDSGLDHNPVQGGWV
jgi:hypothetical protein